MKRLSWISLLCLLAAGPAAAELQVQLSKTTVDVFEPISITVTEPNPPADAATSDIAVQATMVDSSDQRHPFYLTPGRRMGEWVGHFTPRRSGRYTGSVALQRGEEAEVGLVPGLRVLSGSRPGFLQLHTSSSRVLQYSRGGVFFPMGVRLLQEDPVDHDWPAELRKLRDAGLNYLELPVAAPGSTSSGEQGKWQATIDRILAEADRLGGFGIQLRFEPPNSSEIDRYTRQLQRCAARWSYSPSVAFWRLGLGEDPASASLVRRCVESIRAADPYRHPVAGPASAAGSGLDIVAAPFDFQRPSNRRMLYDLPVTSSSAVLLPGEDTWQTLVVGGVGLPLAPYRVGAPGTEGTLKRLSALAQAARLVPFGLPAAPLPNVLPVDAPGAFCRYGAAWVGWIATEGERRVRLPLLPRGPYRVRYWDAETGSALENRVVESDGTALSLVLPGEPSGIAVLVTRGVGGGTPGGLGGGVPPQLDPDASARRAAAQQARRERRAAAWAAERKKRQARAEQARIEAARKAAIHAELARQNAARREAERKRQAALKARGKGKGGKARPMTRAEKTAAAKAAKAAKLAAARAAKLAKAKKAAAAKPAKKPAKGKKPGAKAPKPTRKAAVKKPAVKKPAKSAKPKPKPKKSPAKPAAKGKKRR
jgi:hypothetical protein